MSIDNFTALKKLLTESVSTQGMSAILQELRFFFQVLRVKLEAKDHAIKLSANQELKELKALLENHPQIRKSLGK
jgi:hypothetical protein